MFKDLREFIKATEKIGELKEIRGADINLEMSTIYEIICREGKKPAPVILFDEIPGFPKGFRTLFGLLASPQRLAMALDLHPSEKQLQPMDVIQGWRIKARNLPLIPPKYVDYGPMLENVMKEEEVDLMKFPSPLFHEGDGGRYIGTGHTVILKNADSDWVNLGTYRCMLVDRNRIALHILGGQQGRIIIDHGYFNRGTVLPVAIGIGLDPALWFASTLRIPWGVSEYDYAGGIRGEPEEVIKGPYTGLPLPAHAEIVVEGECLPGEYAEEGPFGEWNGYYANLGSKSVPEPVIRVKAVYYRTNPILTCVQPTVPPSETTALYCIAQTAKLWETLEQYGIPGIKGVWCHEEGGGGPLFNVISIEQMYAGHSTQVGLMASQSSDAIVGRYTVVVDEDIDPSNLSQVIWAIATRTVPDQSIHFLKRCGSSSADPAISPQNKISQGSPVKFIHGTRAIIDACRPIEWKEDWYPIARVSSELRTKILNKWTSILPQLGK